MITIYTQPDCGPCCTTINFVKRLGLDFCTLPADEHKDYLRELGHTSAPVIVTADGDHFSGFRPNLLAALA